MAQIKLRNAAELSDFGKPYIVAEVNTSHFGNIDIAKKMIDSVKKAGCDCVKFQSWTEDTLYSETYYKENPIAKRFTKKFCFSENELNTLADYCFENNINFASTPYSKKEVDFLVKRTDVPYIKVASMDLVNYPYLDYIARTGVPIILSTGMSSLDEIKKAINVIELAGNTNICILHCISIYPAKPETLQLNNILMLRQEFPNYPIGFSDHSEGPEISAATIALGSCMIEKHFTLDSSKIGMDNQMASEPEEMATLVRNCHKVFSAMGTRERIVSTEELEQRKNMRRSIITTKDLKSGSTIDIDDLDAKRPGTGIPPEKIGQLVGKTVTKDIKAGMLIHYEDILEPNLSAV